MQYRMQKALRLWNSAPGSPSASSIPNDNNNNDDDKNKQNNTDNDDGSLSSILNKMTLEERSYALHDIHGVADQAEETPEMLTKHMKEMDYVLDNASSLLSNIDEDPLAYQKARAMSLEYVQRLQIQCLRSDLYNPRNAAIRLIRFFDHKLKLFGENKLVDEIRYRDLDEESVDCLRRGFGQLLPHRDRSGRVIILIYGKLNTDYSMMALVSFQMQCQAVPQNGVVVVLAGWHEEDERFRFEEKKTYAP